MGREKMLVGPSLDSFVTSTRDSGFLFSLFRSI